MREFPMAGMPRLPQAVCPHAGYTGKMDMTDLAGEHLRGICSSVDALRTDVGEIKTRLLGVEQGMAVLRQGASNLRSIVAEQGVRLARLDTRVKCIEQRLELAD